ncbi:OPT oligopeptide transporter [Rhizoctonia solani]|nr:OPT oligopeptide transporter [Rhizoctonia solani]
MADIVEDKTSRSTPSFEKKDPEFGLKVEPVSDEVVAAVTGAEFDDPNLDRSNLGDLEEDSPYPEVRSAVANTDDPDMPCSTLRAWMLGLVWAIVLPGLNQFFYFRYPSVTIGNLVAQLLSFPMGRFLAYILPRWTVFGLELNPGPFSIKEHVLITVMATVGAAQAYATDIVAVQRVFYGQTWNFSYQWMVVMSTQLIGFSIGGIARRFLVAPPSMIWPANLVYCALFNTLHRQHYAGAGTRGGISRERFFLFAFLGSFCWYFLPGYLFTALSYFSWVCWIAPNNVKVNQMFGVVHGLGMSLITFDWSQIAYIGSPLATPWWAEANVFAGFVFFFWFLTPILYYSNVWYAQYMPISSRTSYDNQKNPYDVKKILNPDATLNRDAYKAYSPLFLSTTFAISYGLSFASIIATLVHGFLYYRKQIWLQARRSLSEQPDIHARLMSRYPQVPEWWYLVIFVPTVIFGIVSIEVWHTQMPVWAFFLALVISFVYIIPIGMIQAITNQQVGLNVITELIIAGPLYEDSTPPNVYRQVVATIIAGTTQLGVQAWMFTNIAGMCSEDQPDGFICPGTQVFGTASIIWGVIGPGLQFSKGQLYYGLVFFFLFGAIAPIIPWAITKRYPNSFFTHVNLPVILNGTGSIPPASAINYVPWAIVGFIFQYVIRKRNFQWWTKYNYVLSAALDSGVAISIIIIFFCLQYPKNGTIGANNVMTWWGNTVYSNTADASGTPLRVLAPGEKFGPSVW